MQWIANLMDSRLFLRIDAAIGLALLGLFVYFYFTKEGKDERGRGIVASASFTAFAMLFVVLNVLPYFLHWLIENVVRMSNGIQLTYNIFLLTADVALLVLRRRR